MTNTKINRNIILLFVILIISDNLFSQTQKPKIDISEKTISVKGNPVSNDRYSLYDRYGVNPAIAWCANADNSYDIAYLDNDGDSIKIINMAANDSVIKEWGVKAIGKTRKLLGFTKIPTDSSYIIGYSKDNNFKDFSYQYWIIRIDKNGKTIFNTLIFGDKSSKDVGSKGEPGEASSARIAYNSATKFICFFIGHKMKWSDNVRHQGSYLGFLDLSGKQLTRHNSSNTVGNTWFCSHDFDQRLLVSDTMCYTLSHGDAYPRALVFASWTSNIGSYSSLQTEKKYFEIPGQTGDNTTETQTGGFTQLSDGMFGIIFASKIKRKAYDVNFVKIDKKGNIRNTVWLTNYTTQNAAFPRIAKYGKANTLVAWEAKSGSGNKTMFMILNSANAVSAKYSPSNFIPMPATFDMINLPNGDILWAVSQTDHSISIYRIKPKALK